MSEPTATENTKAINRKEVTVAKLKKQFATAESYAVPPQPRRYNKRSNKTCLHKKQVSRPKRSNEIIELKLETE